MTEDELRDILEKMRVAGLQPQLCDTPVPWVDVPVLAGNPTEAGDVTQGDFVLLPRQLVGRHPVFLIDVDGLSMCDADIMPGDRLEVEMGTPVEDGDTVVAEIDGNFTVKTLFTDNEGMQWLVPRNDEYDPILLTGHQWRIIGKVTGLRKGVPRTSYSDCAKAVMRVRREKGQQEPAAGLGAPMPVNLIFRQFHNRRQIDFAAIREQVERVVVRQMRHRYEWYAAYRILLDLGLLEELQLSKFAQQMQAWFPDVPIRCTSDSMGDYAIGHTSKAFSLWSSDQFRAEMRKGQSVMGFNTLYHRCQELRAALFPLPVLEMQLPF